MLAGATYNSPFMFMALGNRISTWCLVALVLTASAASAASGASWNGVLVDSSGKPVAEAVVKLHPTGSGRDYTATSAANGKFALGDIAAGLYELSATASGKEWRASRP